MNDYDPECCSICFHKFTRPVILNCGHTFCEICVNTCIQCPICRENITSTIVNWQVIDLIDNMPVKYDNEVFDNFLMKYIKVKNWNKLKKGDRIAYILHSPDSSEYLVNRGWIYEIDIKRKIIYIFVANNYIKEINISRFKDIWHYPANEIEPSSCNCQIL